MTQEQINTTQMNYANAMKRQNTHFPGKEQAIIIPTIENTQIIEYLKAIGNIVGGKNITFASKIANKRICIYLNNKEMVDKLIISNPSIKINNTTLQIRKLINPAIRIVISNVCPYIPHDIIEKCFEEIGIKTVSPISFMRAGIPDEQYDHILGFKRQVYIAAGSKHIQDSMVITFEDTQYRIFLSGENIICHKCSEVGHYGKCNDEKQQEEQERNNRENELATEDMKNNKPSEEHESEKIINTRNSEPEINPVSKRPRIADEPANENTSTITPTQEALQTNEQRRKARKQYRSESPPTKSVEELLEPIKEEMTQNQGKYALSYENFKTFIENIQGSTDQLNIARDYTDNIPKLLDTIKRLHPLLTHRAIKNRFTRLTTKIKTQLARENDNKSDTAEFSDPGEYTQAETV